MSDEKNTTTEEYKEPMDIIIVDIRMHIKKNGAVRNHGTAFRIDEKFLYLSFSKKVKLV